MSFDTESAASSINSTQFSLVTEFEALPCSAERDMIIMASLSCPSTENIERLSRAPVDLCCVLDKSGSMAGEKLRLVKSAMKFVIMQFKSQDRLSIVIFDAKVTVILKLQKMDADGKAIALKKMNDLSDEGSTTNLSGGLQEGLSLLSGRQESNDVTSLLLFTDGLANVGIMDTTQIVQMTKAMLSIMPPCSVFTFGFGSDHNASMLQEISNAAQGTYYFISREDEIPSAFGDCVGGLLSVAAQNVKVVFRPNGKYSLQKILSSYPVETLENDTIELRIGDMYSEERKDLLFLIKVNKAFEECEDVLASSTLSYFDIITLKPIQETKNWTMKRIISDVPVNGSQHLLIDKQRNRITATAALKAAAELGANGDVQQAKDTLLAALNAITASSSASDPFCIALVQDIQNLMQTMRDRVTYMSGGGFHTTMNMMSTHGQQRCTSTAYSVGREQIAQQSYNTRSKYSGMNLK